MTNLAPLIGAALVAATISGTVACAASVDTSRTQIITGAINVEDMISLDSRWIIGSSYSIDGAANGLYLFNSENKKFRNILNNVKVEINKKSFPNCPGVPAFDKISTHGLDYFARTKVLYVVNHGARESIETFRVDKDQKGEPRLTWTGCIVGPKNSYLDAVAALDDGRLLISSLWNPNDPARDEKLRKGMPIGSIFSWSTKGGWNVVPGTEGFSAPNGLVATRDGKQAFVALWASQDLARIDMTGVIPKVTTIRVDYHPDNLRWNAAGTGLFVGGQAEAMGDLLACSASKQRTCPTIKLKVDLLDPKSMQVSPVVPAGVYDGMSAGTGAIEVGRELWLTTFKGDRIAIMAIRP